MRRFGTSTGTAIAALALSSLAVCAQVRVNPTGVNVNAQGATTVFLTFGGVAGYEAVEAFWCGELIPASPATGLRCDPATIFGQLPVRYDRSGASGIDALTDVMTIPPSVSRRAYQAAEDGASSEFFYVRRFRSVVGGPDQFVAVTCRLTGGGARAPLSLTDVRLSFIPGTPVLQVAPGEPPPRIEANIAYTGTGRLVGRWEVVLPGEELPTADDLLTEATLPLERRGTQRRYTQVSSFNIFLPPVGRVELHGPDPDRLPTTTDGVYYLLFRVEATTDKEADSDLSAVGAGRGIAPGGAVAGFPMPVLRYVVGSGQPIPVGEASARTVQLIAPAPDAAFDPVDTRIFTWRSSIQAALFTIEFETQDGEAILSALVPGEVAAYRVPTWFPDRIDGRPFRWRVRATDAAGRELGISAWRNISS